LSDLSTVQGALPRRRYRDVAGKIDTGRVFLGGMVKRDLKTFYAIGALAIFVGLPVLFYALGEVPRRSLLKESISLVTLLAFSLMIGQFFLARSNKSVIELFDHQHIQNLHKVIAYPALIVFLLHPFLIVFPGYFEAGVDPIKALVRMLSLFDNLGILLGMIAWVLLLIISLTAIFHGPLITLFVIKYRNWRKFHGYLSVIFIVLATWHAVELGRHSHGLMAAFFIVVAAVGITLLLNMYFSPEPNPEETS
jgi:predicted ferric reductase